MGVFHVALIFPLGVYYVAPSITNRISPFIRRISAQIRHSIGVTLHLFFNSLIDVN